MLVENECGGAGGESNHDGKTSEEAQRDMVIGIAENYAAQIEALKTENAALKERIEAFERIQASGDSAARDDADRARRAQRRAELERDILVEGCALLRETACAYAPVVAKATRLQETIYRVMRDPAEMQKEIDRRLADPKRTWWNDPK